MIAPVLRRAAGLALVVPAIALAQRPLPPDTVPLASRVAHPTAGQQLPAAVRPFLVRSGDAARAVIASPQASVALDDVAGMEALARSCAQAGATTLERPHYVEAPLTLDRTAHLVVVATGAPAALRVCEEEWNEGSLSVWKGLSITDSVSGSPARRAAPRAATLVVDGAVLTPLASVSRPALEHSRGGWHAGDRQLRYYYDFRALAPRPDGAAHRVQLVFWPEGGALVETLPETAARSLGDQYVAWRLQDARDSVTAPLAYAPRRAVGGPVGDAMAEAARGRTPRAAVQLAEWMVAGASSRDFAPESRVAKLLLADILLQHGDSLVARAYVADARHDQPCLGAPAGASGGLRRIVDSFRAPAECDELSPRRALMNGLMLPGLGHAVNGSRWLAAGAGSLVAGVLASAVMLQSQGNARYAEYQAATSFSSAPRLYAEATDLRAQARSRAAFGIVLWAADAALSAFEAQFRNREVRDAQQ